MATTDPEGEHGHEVHQPFKWSAAELQALGLVLAVLAILGAATALFGLGGLISVAVATVPLLFLIMIWISRG